MMRRSLRTGLLLALLLALLPSGLGQAAPAAGPVRLRVGVSADGIAVIRPDDLAGAGVDPATVDPATFAMSSLGQPVSIWIENDDGAAPFGPNERLLFFGQRYRGVEMDQKYTDERVYWLDIGGTPGPRMQDVSAAPAGDLTPPPDFATTLRAEESLEWWTLHTLYADTQDTWFWAQMNTTGGTVTSTLPYAVPHPAAGSPATFRLEQMARSTSGTAGSLHRTKVTFNGSQIIDQTWNGLKVRRNLTAALSPGTLVHGLNTVTVGAWNEPGVTLDWVYANFWEVDYRRLFRAWQDRLDFVSEAPGPQEYLVSGWASDQVAVWDVSTPATPRRLTGAALEPESGSYRLRFRANEPAGSRYWLQDSGTFRSPDSVTLRPPTDLRTPGTGAGVVIVTHASLSAAAQRLAGWHADHGRAARVVDIQDAYDEFNDGIYHPKAVQAMMIWASQQWPDPKPAYLVLVGDGHWNFKNYNPAVYPPQPNLIPPFLAWVDPWQGEVPADPLFGDLNNDKVPDLAVGRLAANTLEEANAVVDKIVAYDEDRRLAAWQRRAIFVADNKDSAGDFPKVSDEIIAGYLARDLTAERIYLGSSAEPDVAAARAAIAGALNAGALMVQFAGHGAASRWTHESIWVPSDIAALAPSDKLPVIMTFNCLDGYFASPQPANFSIAELMQRRAGAGSVAAISPSGLGLTSDQQNFRKILMNLIFKDGVRELGPALTQAKQKYVQSYGNDYLVQTMMLFGDPALRLPDAVTQHYLPLLTRGF